MSNDDNDDEITTVRLGGYLELEAGATDAAVHTLVQRIIATMRAGAGALAIVTQHGPVKVVRKGHDIFVTSPKLANRIELDHGDWAGLSTALLDVFGELV